jgi:flagellar biosynthesis protein FlhG
MFRKIRSEFSKYKKNDNFSDKVLHAYYNRDEKNAKLKQMGSSKKSEINLNQSQELSQNDNISATSNINFQSKKNPIIISIGGGKGGIGKSFLTANIAIRLANLGFKVSAIDLDLGAANLHTCLGVPTPTKAVSDFFHGDVQKLEETGQETSVSNLTLYGGNQDFWQQVKPHGSQKIKFINYLQELNSDYILIDLGAGTHVHTLDFFIFSDAGLLVVVPEPTSIENAYVFMKSVMSRKIQNICRAFEINSELEQQILQKVASTPSGGTPFSEFSKCVQQSLYVDPEIINIIKATNIGILMNQVRTQEDKDLGMSMSAICSQYFGFSSQFVGSMRYDDAVWKSIRIRKPLIIDNPNSVASLNIYKMTDELIRMYEPYRKEMSDSTSEDYSADRYSETKSAS